MLHAVPFAGSLERIGGEAGAAVGQHVRDPEGEGAERVPPLQREDCAIKPWDQTTSRGHLVRSAPHRTDHARERLARTAAPTRVAEDEGERAAASPNLLEWRFAADASNRKWIADFTYIWTAEGCLYVAAVVDLFSRRVVGWSMQASMTAQLVTEALVMAIWRDQGTSILTIVLSNPYQAVRFRRGAANLWIRL